MSAKQLDIVGLGGLNYDYIVSLDQDRSGARTAGHWANARLPEILDWIGRDHEMATGDRAAFAAALREIRKLGFRVATSYGGSAYNTIRAIASLRVGINLGYVGAIGEPPEGSGSSDMPPIRTFMDHLGIDTSRVFDHLPPGYAGATISLLHNGRRELRTLFDPTLPGCLDAHREELVDYLCEARYLHVTSLFGPNGPSAIAGLVNEVRKRAPEIVISVDPGSVWCHSAESDDQVADVLRTADLIFLNEDEFEALGLPETDDGRRADLIRQRYGNSKALLLLKSWADVSLYRPGSRTPDRLRQNALPPARVDDSTGAGDVFASGVLAALTSERGRACAGTLLGLALARHKLQRLADKGYESLEEVLVGDKDQSMGPVFVSHAESDHATVQLFVELLELAGVATEQIFCTGIPDTGIPAGSESLREMHRHLERASLVVMLISRSFLDSRFCRYEVGASWALSKEHFPLCLADVLPADLDDLMRSRQAVRLNDPGSLDHLRARMIDLGIAVAEREETWTRHRDVFLQRLEGLAVVSVGDSDLGDPA